jgi:predicted nuclease of restriction endonuclease-like (RecB) superfamily
MTVSTGQDAGGEPEGYAELITALKERVRSARFRTSRAVNTELLRLYWSVGRDILDRQECAGWGGKVVARIAADMKRDFPKERGWSRSSLLYMRRAAEVWPTEAEFVQQVAGRLPWTFVQALLDRLGTREERDWYAARAAESGWSRTVREHQIEVNLRSALEAAPTNFTEALDAPDSELALQLVKDPYVFEHLALSDRIDEREVEQALMDRLRDTLLEFGRGMSFVGRQVRLAIVGRDDRRDRRVLRGPALLLDRATALRRR